jgi:LPXTG-motif cell wall-anchored protein
MGLAGTPKDAARSRAETIKEVYLVGNGETLLERMKVEVPRRLNWEETGASDIPKLREYYRQYDADPEKVAKAWKNEFPDLFPGSIHAHYNTDGTLKSDNNTYLPVTTAGGGDNQTWLILGGIAVAGGLGLYYMKNQK